MSLLAKLRIKPELDLFLLNAPELLPIEFANAISKKALTKKEKAAQVILFAKNKAILEKQIPQIISSLEQDTLFWVIYPKKTGNIPSDLSRDESWQILFQFNWEGVSSAAIDENWTALRFRHRESIKNLKRAFPMEERKTEGVDYIKRSVSLPEDAVKAMKPYIGLEVFFNSLAFSHKREYVEAIADAKKPETRFRRIEKTIEMVLKLKEQKEAKSKK